MTQAYVTYGAMLLISLIASITDLRTGEIPHKLTWSGMALGLLLGAAYGGLRGFFSALIGIVVCGLVPVIFHRMGGMGGGDVYLFGALGGLGGPSLGLEVELLALTVAYAWGMVMLAYRGRLWHSLKTSGRLVTNMFVPAKRRREVEPEELTTLRIGAAIFVGTLLAVLNRTVFGGLLT